MSEKDSQTGAEAKGASANWWENDEYSEGEYVPGGISATSDSSAESGTPQNDDAARRAEREAASGPSTQAMQAVSVEPPTEALLVGTTGAQATAALPLSASADASEPDTTSALREAKSGTEGKDVPGVMGESTLRASLESKPVFPRVLQWLVAIATPLVLLVGAIRAVASGGFLWLEYHRPGFPADFFGFTTDQRMTYGSYGLDYINNFAGREYLGGLVTPDGKPLFRPEEVDHMVDVQALVHLAYLLGAIALVVMLISFAVLRSRYAGGIRRGLFAGAWVTLGLFAVLGTLGAIGWENFFTSFHEVFFSHGNWQFYLDDTLIRLYPPQFWVDSAIVIAALVFIVCVTILICTWPTRARRERSRAQQAQREFRLS